jgi:hypothetical protein
MASLMYNTLFETPYNDELMRRVRENALRKEHYNPTEPYHISYMTYPSVNGSGRNRVLMCGGARNGDPRSLGLDHDPRYLRSGSTINFPNYQFSAMMANPASGGIRSNDGFHFVDDFNPYYNRVVSANMGTARPSFSRGGSKVGNFFKSVGKFLKPVGREVMPIVKDVGKDLLKDAIKGAIVGAGVKRRGRPRKVVGVGQFEGSGHPVGSPIPNDMYMGSGKLENKVIRVMTKKMTGGVALYKPNGKIFRGMTHVMPDGVIHTGKTHTKSSVPLTEMTAGNARTFFRKVGNTLKTIGKAVAPVAVPVLKEVGKDLLKGAIMGAVVGAGKRGRPKGSGGKRSNVNSQGDPKMCCFPASECGAKPTRAGRPKGAKNKKSGGSGMSVDSAGILSVTPNPPPALQVVGGKSNIGRKIKNTFKKIGKFLEPAVPVLKDIGKEVYKEVKPILVEEGKKALKEGIKGAVSGSGTKKGQVRKTARKAYEGGKKPNARAEIVRKVMKERGVKMIEASKIVKAEGLY